MATYCDCGAVATHFYDECGNEIEPCCDECHEHQLEMVAEMFGRQPEVEYIPEWYGDEKDDDVP